MRRTTKALLASLAVAFTSHAAFAADILLDKNGFADLSGGQVTQNSGPAFFQSIGNTAAPVTLTGLTPGNTYNVDFFHNAGSNDSNFQFSIDGAGEISFIGPNGYGGGTYTVATASTPTTLLLNTHSFTYNNNNGQKGGYNLNGVRNGVNSGDPLIVPGNYGPQTFNLIPGDVNVDNTYNSGGGNEDFTFAMNTNGDAVISNGTSGPGSNPIPWKEYATVTAPGSLDINHIIAHFHVVASRPISLNNYQPITPPVITGGSTYDFDMDMTVGNGGLFFSTFGDYVIDGGNAVHWDGQLWTDVSHNNGTNDYAFLPLLRYDSTYANGYDYYFQNGTDGRIATGSATGWIDGPHNPGDELSVTVTATLIPEPASLALLAVGSLLMLRRRRAL